MGLSLWLVPTAEQLNSIRSVLPRGPSTDRLPSANSYPALIPHITLATVPNTEPTTLDVLLDAVPANQQSIRAHFQSLAVGNHYFRSVFVDIEPTQELVDFQSQIVTNLNHQGLQPSAPRFPHMSLCYITEDDANEREKTAHALRTSGAITESHTGDRDGISLRCGEASLSGFDGVEVWIVNCDGPVERWEVGKKIELLPKP